MNDFHNLNKSEWMTSPTVIAYSIQWAYLESCNYNYRLIFGLRLPRAGLPLRITCP